MRSPTKINRPLRRRRRRAPEIRRNLIEAKKRKLAAANTPVFRIRKRPPVRHRKKFAVNLYFPTKSTKISARASAGAVERRKTIRRRRIKKDRVKIRPNSTKIPDMIRAEIRVGIPDVIRVEILSEILQEKIIFCNKTISRNEKILKKKIWTGIARNRRRRRRLMRHRRHFLMSMTLPPGLPTFDEEKK